MERLFSPCTYYFEMLVHQGRIESFTDPPGGLRELSLDVSTEELLSAERAFTFADLYAMIGNEDTIVWLTPHAAVMSGRLRGIRPWSSPERPCRSYFRADGKELFALAPSPEALSEICDVVLQLLAASVVRSVHIHKLDSHGGSLFNAPTLAYLMGQCQSLKALSLESLKLDENQIRVLGAYSRPDLEIELIACKATSATTSTLAEVLGRNQGPHCSIVTNIAVRLYHTLIRQQSSQVCRVHGSLGTST
jgi:hypothetical protein